MTRVHDMGGRFGDGAVQPEPDGIPQLGAWQRRALALVLAAGALGQWNIDISRHARERLAPADYARFTYFEKWIAALADLLVEAEVLTKADLQGQSGDGAHNIAQHPLAERMLKPEAVASMLAQGSPSNRPSDIGPPFQIGQVVRTLRPAANRRVQGGHTRLPTYAAGAQGRILRAHGGHVLPDSNAHRFGEAPEPLYAVAFAASELWAAPENPNDEVVLDLWHSYLEPVCSGPDYSERV